MRTHKTVLNSAVGIALAALGTAAFAGQFTGPAAPSSDKLIYAVENFGPAAFTALDNITLTTPFSVIFTTSVGQSGGYVVNNGGEVYYYLRLIGGGFAATPVAGDFNLNLFPGAGWDIVATNLSTDGSTVVLTLQNNTGFTQSIGSGAQVIWNGGSKVLRPGTGLRTIGGTIAVDASISATTANPNVAALPRDVDGASSTWTIVETAKALATAVTANAAVKKIAVDEFSQRRLFNAGPDTSMNMLGTVEFPNVAGLQGINDAQTTDYTHVNPVGRTLTFTVTAGAGSFNAAQVNGVFASTSSTCSPVVQAATLNAAKTVATFTDMPVAAFAADHAHICYHVTGTTQIGEVTGIAVAGLLNSSNGGRNDQTVAITGSLANVVNDGTVIDARIYIPVSVNQFGYGMSLRVINTGSNAAEIFAQYIYNDGTLSTQGKVSNAVPVGGYVMLDNTQIEAAIGAPDAAKGSNPRVKITAPTSSLRVQTFMRTNGIWAEVSGGQAEPQNAFGAPLPMPNDK